MKKINFCCSLLQSIENKNLGKYADEFYGRQYVELYLYITIHIDDE